MVRPPCVFRTTRAAYQASPRGPVHDVSGLVIHGYLCSNLCHDILWLHRPEGLAQHPLECRYYYFHHPPAVVADPLLPLLLVLLALVLSHSGELCSGAPAAQLLQDSLGTGPVYTVGPAVAQNSTIRPPLLSSSGPVLTLKGMNMLCPHVREVQADIAIRILLPEPRYGRLWQPHTGNIHRHARVL